MSTAAAPRPGNALSRALTIIRGGARIAWYASPASFLFMIGLSLLNGLAGPATIWAGKHFVDAVFAPPGSEPNIGLAVGLMAGVGAAGRLVGVLSNSRQELFANLVNFKTQERFVDAVSSVDQGHFDDPEWHDRLQRATDGLNYRPGQLMYSVTGLAGTMAGLLGTFAVIAGMDPLILVLAVVSVLPVFLVQSRTERGLYAFFFGSAGFIRERDYLRDLLSAPRYSKEIRAFGLAPTLAQRHEKLNAGWYRSLRSLYNRAIGFAFISVAINAGAMALAFAIVVREAHKGNMTPGDLTAVIAAVAAIATQAGVLLSTSAALNQSGLFLGEYWRFLATPRLVEVPDSPRMIPTGVDAGLQVQGLTFRYPTGDRNAIDGVSFEVKPGQLVAIVGDNGSGKTTLIKTLLRLYAPTQGCVVLNGVDLSDADPIEVRRHFGVLFQDFAQYELTVRENVSFGRPDDEVNDSEVLEALESAQGTKVLNELGGNLDARVGRILEGGRDLSGGQWQRLALARLMYRDADVWVLDEPTSALDAAAEAAIFTELGQSLHGRMGIVISHRFSTVRNADLILVMAHGQILERGSHEELLAQNGRYAELFNLQAAGYR